MKKYFTVITYEGYYAEKALDELEGGDWIVEIEGDFKRMNKKEIQKHLEYLEDRIKYKECNNYTPVEIDPYWKDIIDETNRRFYDR